MGSTRRGTWAARFVSAMGGAILAVEVGMRTYSLRFIFMLSACGVGLLVHHIVRPSRSTGQLAWPVEADRAASNISTAKIQSQRCSNEILTVLLPADGTWADVSQLDKYDPSEVITAMKGAKPHASGDRALAITFLLAALREDYQANKSKLLTALSDYRRQAYSGNCVECIADYLSELAKRGDTSLIAPLLEVSDLADGALAESLGVFYSDTLSRQPKEFLVAATRLTTESQELVCELASREDGGGMSDNTFRAVKRSLNTIGRQNTRLAVAARRCIGTLQRGKTQADAN